MSVLNQNSSVSSFYSGLLASWRKAHLHGLMRLEKAKFSSLTNAGMYHVLNVFLYIYIYLFFVQICSHVKITVSRKAIEK